MGIGTSLGAYFEDPTDHASGVDQDVLNPPDIGDKNEVTPSEADRNKKVKDRVLTDPYLDGLKVKFESEEPLRRVYITGATESENIDDRREEPNPRAVEWKNVIPAIKDLAWVAAHNLGLTSIPSIPESPQSELSDQLGREDIKIEKAVPSRSTLDNMVDGVADAATFFGGIYDAIKGQPRTKYGDDVPFSEKQFSEGTKIGNRLFGLNGEERLQLWPEKMVRDLATTAGNVMAGKVPMWGFDMDSGEFHTSIEGLEAAHKLMPAANGGTFPKSTTIHIQGPAHEALQEGPDAFAQFMANRGRNQPSNITEAPVPVEPEPPVFESIYRQQPYTDHMSDAEFYRYGEYQPEGSLTPAQEARWNNLDSRYAGGDHEWQQQVHDYERYVSENMGTEEDLMGFSQRDWRAGKDPAYLEKITKARKGDKPELIREASSKIHHIFGFADKNGVGEIHLTEKNGGKELYVSEMGTVLNKNGTSSSVLSGLPENFGHKAIATLLRQLAAEFPKAEYISGFRVSGARSIAGKGAATARMKIPRRSN